MSRIGRTVGVLSLIALVAGSFAASADGPKVETGLPLKPRFQPRTDERLAEKLTDAAEAFRKHEWDRAFRLIQQVLDAEDAVVPRGDKPGEWVGSRAEAVRLLAELSPDDRGRYSKAQRDDAAALMKGDDRRLAEVVRRFLFTDAGAEALEQLANLHLAAGRPHLAAGCYAQLLSHKAPAQWTTEVLFQAATAFRTAGDAENAAFVAKRLLGRSGAEGLRIGGNTYSRDELRKELGPTTPGGDWLLYGGDPARAAEPAVRTPSLEAFWFQPTLTSDVSYSSHIDMIQELRRSAMTQAEKAGETILPAAAPVAVSATRKGQRFFSVVYCTTSAVIGIDPSTGKRMARGNLDGTLDWMLKAQSEGGAGAESVLKAATESAIYKNECPGVIFENSLISALSSDGASIFVVEDLAVPLPTTLLPAGYPKHELLIGGSEKFQRMVGSNRLNSYNLSRDLSLRWKSGVDQDEFADSFFLGPPLPLDGRLYVLNQDKNDLRLVCLDPATGKKISIKTIAGLRDPLWRDPLRRMHACHLAYADGVLVCPTNSGGVVGVDLVTETLAWQHRYEEAPAPAAGQPPSGWKNTAPVVAGGTVLFAPPDGCDLTCLDLVDGAVRWAKKREADDLYFAGVVAGRALVVGKKTCRAYDVANGDLVWTLKTGVPSGRGAAGGGRYYLPLTEGPDGGGPELCVVDVGRGAVADRIVVPKDAKGKADPLGNLVFTNGFMLSQSAERIVCFPPAQATPPKPEEAPPAKKEG
jgi:outer membrane protein assembly factor BamB